MKRSITTAFIGTIALVAFFAACSHSPASNQVKSSATVPQPYVKVFVSKSGEINLDGKTATLDEVGKTFAALAPKKGIVLYARESPEQYEPHPNAMRVIELLTQNSLPIRLCANPDCSDALDTTGNLKMND
ncbi:MAG TPA: hypothetical protein VGQ39_06290 [Pyrinomonadaceae bacterium]|jgi:hypothetical protein|nr:hypothetical protein [Pyrinomonadaceae bacterium]